MSYSAIVHDFQYSLQRSQSLSGEINWNDFYRGIWGDEIVCCVRIDENSRYQQVGIDRVIMLKNGKQISIDEKLRESSYTDILLEEWSVVRNYNPKTQTWRAEKPGWAMDPKKQCDYIAYAIPKAEKCYLLPFEILRCAMRTNLDAWKKVPKFYPKVAKNRGYHTVNVAIPFPVLRDALNLEMERQYRGVIQPKVDLKNTQVIGKQLEIWGSLSAS